MNSCYLIKTVLAIVAVSFANSVVAQSTPRSGMAQESMFDHSTVEGAWKEAIQRKRPLLVMFTSDNCTYCRKMAIDTYGNPQIRQLLRGKTESVMAHSDDYADLIKKLGIRGYPSSLLISPEGEVLDFIEGYLEPKAFAVRVGPLLDPLNKHVKTGALSNVSNQHLE